MCSLESDPVWQRGIIHVLAFNEGNDLYMCAGRADLDATLTLDSYTPR